MKTRIWYSVSNGGYGSAYPHFFYDEEVAEIHQESQSEGWGESCVSYLDIEHEGDIKVDGCQTLDEYLTECIEEEAEEPIEKLKALKEKRNVKV